MTTIVKIELPASSVWASTFPNTVLFSTTSAAIGGSIAWPPAMPVPPADIHQRTQAAFGNDLFRSPKRRMESMIESDPQYQARAICMLLQRSQLGGTAATRFLHEDMLTRFERCQRAGDGQGEEASETPQPRGHFDSPVRG